MSQARRLVIGVGNPDAGDDGAGIAVARALAERNDCAHLVTYVCTGEAASLMEAWTGFDDVVIVDACRGAGPPGSVHTFTPDDLERYSAVETRRYGSTHGLGVARRARARPRARRASMPRRHLRDRGASFRSRRRAFARGRSCGARGRGTPRAARQWRRVPAPGPPETNEPHSPDSPTPQRRQALQAPRRRDQAPPVPAGRAHRGAAHRAGAVRLPRRRRAHLRRPRAAACRSRASTASPPSTTSSR